MSEGRRHEDERTEQGEESPKGEGRVGKLVRPRANE